MATMDRDEVIGMVFRLKGEGLGPTAIARKMEADGIPTLTGKGRWMKGTVSNILRGRHGPPPEKTPGKQRTTKEIEALRAQLTATKNRLEAVSKELEATKEERDTLRAELAKYQRPTAELKVGKWNVQKSGGFYRAFRKVGGMTRAVYLGKRFDEDEAREKIMNRFPDIGID
jgi:hypothetical protein